MEKPANKSSGENHIESADFLGLMKNQKVGLAEYCSLLRLGINLDRF